MPAHRVLERVYSLVKYSRFDCVDTASQLAITSSSWNFLATLAVTRRVLIISWEPPSLGFVKLNFDNNVRNARGGAGFVIRDPDTRLLTATGSPLFEPSIRRAELRAAWISIIYASQVLELRGSLLREILPHSSVGSRMR